MKMLMKRLIDIICYLIAVCSAAGISVCFGAGFCYIAGSRSERDIIMGGLLGGSAFIANLIIWLILKLLKRLTKALYYKYKGKIYEEDDKFLSN